MVARRSPAPPGVSSSRCIPPFSGSRGHPPRSDDRSAGTLSAGGRRSSVLSWHEPQAILAPVYVAWHAPQAATAGSSGTAAGEGVAVGVSGHEVGVHDSLSLRATSKQALPQRSFCSGPPSVAPSSSSTGRGRSGREGSRRPRSARCSTGAVVPPCRAWRGSRDPDCRGRARPCATCRRRWVGSAVVWA